MRYETADVNSDKGQTVILIPHFTPLKRKMLDKIGILVLPGEIRALQRGPEGSWQQPDWLCWAREDEGLKCPLTDPLRT